MKYLVRLTCLFVIFQTADAQKIDPKYKISAAQRMEYETLAEALTVNIDTAVTLTKVTRKKAFDAKLGVFLASHKLVVQEAELRTQLKELRKKQRVLRKEGDMKVATLMVSNEEKRKLPNVWKKEKGYLKKIEIAKQKLKRQENLEKKQQEMQRKEDERLEKEGSITK